jgi:hypothetical protein
MSKEGTKMSEDNCNCGFITCICKYKKEHHSSCLFLKAVSCSIGIECDHGYDVCPKCDPCTCESVKHEKG